MFALLLALSLLMIIGGAWAVFAGWELLLLERGWSMLIAGATLATGGFVLAGIVGVARALAQRLDALTEAVRASQRVQAQAALPRRPAPPEQAPPPPPRFPAPPVPTPARPTPAAPLSDVAPAAALGTGALAIGAARLGLEKDDPTGIAPAAPFDETGGADEAIPPREETNDGPGDAAATHEQPDSDESTPAGRGIEAPVLGTPDEATRTAETERFLDRDEAPDTTTDTAEQASAATAPESIEVYPDEEPESAEPESVPSGETDSSPESAPSPDSAPAEPASPAKIIGRHVSGANTYTMYSDGSIEAETPDGRYAFASLDEFRGWIASAGEDPSGTTQSNG